MQTTNWFKKLNQNNKFFLNIKVFSEQLVKLVEECIYTGKMILVEECEDQLPKVLHSVIQKKIYMDKSK